MRLCRIFGLSLTLLCSLTLAAQTYCEAGNGPLDAKAPSTPLPADITQRFSQNESSAKAAMAHYTFTENMRLQTLRNISERGIVTDGEFQQTADISFDAQGKRIEHVTYAPPSTLQRVTLTPEDFDDIRQMMIFPLTADELPHYNVVYVGQQRIDQLDSYVFDVAPKTLNKSKRYFEGRIWVESRDFAIVKTCGKSVPDLQRKGQQSLTPKFVTYREQFSGHWFPTYVRSDDFLFFTGGAIRIRETVKYSNFRQTAANPTRSASNP